MQVGRPGAVAESEGAESQGGTRLSPWAAGIRVGRPNPVSVPDDRRGWQTPTRSLVLKLFDGKACARVSVVEVSVARAPLGCSCPRKGGRSSRMASGDRMAFLQAHGGRGVSLIFSNGILT